MVRATSDDNASQGRDDAEQDRDHQQRDQHAAEWGAASAMHQMTSGNVTARKTRAAPHAARNLPSAIWSRTAS